MRPPRPLVAAALVLAACGGPATDPGASVRRQEMAGRPPLHDVPRQILFEGPLLVVPGMKWEEHRRGAGPAGGGWRFRTFARIHFLAREAPAAPLVLRLLPDAETATFDFEILWDGRQLGEAAIRRQGQLLAIEVAAEKVPPGRHEMILKRLHRQPPKGAGKVRHGVIIVTSDHGELLGEGGYISHGGRLDPELMEIPLVIKWPHQERGERDGRLVSLIDLFPTLLAAAGLEAPASDGRSLAPRTGTPRTDPEPWRSLLLYEEHEFIIHPLPEYMKVARHVFGVQRPGFRQLVWEGDQECARRLDDGWQSVACGGEPGRILRSIEAELGAADGGPDPQAPLSDEMRRSLEALGYL